MPIEKKNTELTKRIAEKLGVKNNTARVEHEASSLVAT